MQHNVILTSHCCVYIISIRMTSEGSCDTEDYINDAENSTLHHRNKLHLKNTLLFFKLKYYNLFYYKSVQSWWT